MTVNVAQDIELYFSRVVAKMFTVWIDVVGIIKCNFPHNSSRNVELDELNDSMGLIVLE